MTRLLPWAKMPPARLGDLDFEFFMQEIPLFLICLNSTTVFRSACVTGIEELNVHHLTLVKKGWLRAFSFSKRHLILFQDVTMSKDMEEKEDKRSD